jgi:hypothetical protein
MITSCSFKTLYNQLDNMIPYYVEGMVSLDSMLEEKVEQRSLLLIKWHRNTQLNQYADWLRVLQGDINQQLTEEKIHKHIATLERFWDLISLRVDQEMALLLPLLNKEQRKELFSSIDEKNNEFREEYIELKDDERTAQYTDSIIDSYETWLGDLTDEQEVLARQTAKNLQSSASYRLEARLQWQRSIKRILNTNNSTEQKSAALRQFFAEYNSQENVAMNTIMKKNKALFAALTVQIVHSLTAEQKAHFITRSNDYIRMFDELAKEH